MGEEAIIKPTLEIATLQAHAATFARLESEVREPSLYGVTDGKRIGTYLEHKFVAYLSALSQFQLGNSASGIDLPSLNVDLKTTSIRQPQSSSPFKTASQKIFGLGYHLLVFVYDKTDDLAFQTGRLNVLHTIFVDASRTGDYQMTRGLRQIVQNDGNVEDLVAFMLERHLPVDEIQAAAIAEEILERTPEQGYLTISNALQWRLQYQRVIGQAGEVDGLVKIT